MSSRGILLVVALSTAALGLVTGYKVEPKTQAMSGWTRTLQGQDRVSEIITINFDSLKAVALFVGDPSSGGDYELLVQSTPGEFQIATGVAGSPGGYKWADFVLNVTGPESIVKGKKLEFRFTRDGPDSINYYYDEEPDGGPYQYGELKIGEAVAPNRDLCMRVYGQLDTVRRDFFGVNPMVPETDTGLRTLWDSRAEEAGVHMARLHIFWDWVEHDSGVCTFAKVDSQLLALGGLDGGCEVFGEFCYSTPWTSTHVDTVDDTLAVFSVASPPKNMALGVWSSQNHWARFVEKTVKHLDEVCTANSMDTIRTWECWNEPNLPSQFWRVPNVRDCTTATSRWQRCSLYVRLCVIADSVIDSLHGRGRDRILVGSMSQVDQHYANVEDTTGSYPDTLWQGSEWLQDFCDIAALLHVDTCWEDVALHPYPLVWPLGRPYSPDAFQADVEQIRAIMRSEGLVGQLWATEYGRKQPLSEPGTRLKVADEVCQTIAGAAAALAEPGGGYDKFCWFCFRDKYGVNDSFHHGLLSEDMQTYKESFYSFAHVGEKLVGKRCNGRILTGDPGVDEVTRIYEFEDPATDKRMWVGWKNGGVGGGNVGVDVPVRTDVVVATSLAYSSQPSQTFPAPGGNGWLAQSLVERPVFVTEAGSSEVSRPDLRADSVWFTSRQHLVNYIDTLKARVVNSNNANSRATRCTTWVHFYWDTTCVGFDLCTDTIQKGDTVIFSCPLTVLPDVMHGEGLLSARVNRGQAFVELNMDDNIGYQHAYVSNSPRGQLDGQGNTGRLVRQAAGTLVRAFTWDDAAGDYVGLDRTTDCGETWLHLGSPGLGSNPALGYDSDSVACLAWLRSDTLFCAFRGYDTA